MKPGTLSLTIVQFTVYLLILLILVKPKNKFKNQFRLSKANCSKLGNMPSAILIWIVNMFLYCKLSAVQDTQGNNTVKENSDIREKYEY